jgi:hypothetical protein
MPGEAAPPFLGLHNYIWNTDGYWYLLNERYFLGSITTYGTQMDTGIS